VYSFRLGVEPIFWHDDYEYTYPSFSLAARGNLGSPLFGPGLNVENRTYRPTYYFSTVHALLIRVFGAGPESIPLANTFHFAVLAAAGALFLVRRGGFLGLFVLLYALAGDDLMTDAARHGRPEMTAGCCFTLGVLALWLWRGEEQRQPAVLFGMSAAFVAGMLSHASVVFFAAAVLVVFLVPLGRRARPSEVVAALVPYAIIPLLFGYFILTDSVTNILGQLGQSQGNVTIGKRVALVLSGDWGALASLTLRFLQTHVWHPALWLGIAACLAVPALARSRLSRGARFFAAVYVLCVTVHFLCLKDFVPSYRVIYQATFYLALALLAEAILAHLGERWGESAWVTRLRLAGAAVLLLLTVGEIGQFRERLHGRHLPYAGLQGALVYALREAGARPGERVYVPSPFGFHLQDQFDVIAYPAPGRFFYGRWSPDFRQGVRDIWGPQTLERVGKRPLCWAMGLAYLRPKWVLSWSGDFGVMRPFRRFFRRFPDIPGIRLTQIHRVTLPPPYGGRVRVFRLELSDAMRALDRTPDNTLPPCP
jgi:hypothetical protein